MVVYKCILHANQFTNKYTHTYTLTLPHTHTNALTPPFFPPQLICFFYIYFFVPAYWGDYVFPPSIQVLGWLLSASSMGLIPLGALAALCKTKSFRGLFQTSPDLCPAHVRSQRAAQQGSPAPRFEYNNAAFEGSRAKVSVGRVGVGMGGVMG